MLTSVSLANYRSFGALQVVPLQPITILVGPNNSGKSTFLRFFPDFAQAALGDQQGALEWMRRALHRPPVGAHFELGIEATGGSYQARAHVNDDDDGGFEERLSVSDPTSTDAVTREPDGLRVGPFHLAPTAFAGLTHVVHNRALFPEAAAFLAPILASRVVQLSRTALRLDAQAVAQPQLEPDGSGLATVIATWRALDDDRFRRLDAFISRCAPEIEKVLAKPVSGNAHRLVVSQADKQQFEAREVSDGILQLIGLAAHAVAAEPGAILCVEEPESAIHPRRLRQYVDLLRTIVDEAGCQILIATHSPVLVDAFRDEPEAIVHFGRGPQGTIARRLADMPNAMRALLDAGANPGELLTGGYLTEEGQAG